MENKVEEIIEAKAQADFVGIYPTEIVEFVKVQ